MIPCQLRMDSSLRCGRGSSHSGIGIWVLCFPTQRCPNRLPGHTLRSPSQTLERMETFREKDRENGWENSQCPPFLFYFSRVFIMFRCGARLHSAELTLIVMIVQYWPSNHHICRRSRAISNEASWHNSLSLQSCWWHETEHAYLLKPTWGWEESHQSIWCQLGMVSYIREDLRLSRRCEPLNSANGPDRMSLNASKVVRVVMKEVTHGLAGTMPRRQTCGSIRGWTRGIRPLQELFCKKGFK